MTTAKTEPLPADARPEGGPWTYAEAWKFLNISERSFHRLVSEGRIRVIRLGKKPMIPDGEVRRLAAEGT